MTEQQHDRVTRGQIAIKQLQMMKDNPGICAQVSIRAGMHPYYRWTGDEFERAEPVGYGELEVQSVSEDTLIMQFSENPVELMPVREAEYSPREPGKAKVWDSVDDGGDGVVRHA